MTRVHPGNRVQVWMTGGFAMAEERHSDDNEAKDAETRQDRDEQRPGFLGGRLAPVGARAFALAGFVALTMSHNESRSSISFR
jgi:hypothetical protein